MWPLQRRVGPLEKERKEAYISGRVEEGLTGAQEFREASPRVRRDYSFRSFFRSRDSSKFSFCSRNFGIYSRGEAALWIGGAYALHPQKTT